MKRLISFLGIILSFSILLSCSTTKTNLYGKKIEKNKTVVVLPFKNLSQTPLAGIKVASIVKGVLLSKGYKVVDGYRVDKEGNVILKPVEGGYYFVSGKVVEWRYKTGIDGEPAVGVYIEIKDKQGNLLWSGVGSKSQWGHRSLSLTAQQLIDDMLSDISQPEK